MSERFFLAAPPRAGHALLEGDEARHLARVLRAKVGDEVRVFDGSGDEWPATVAAIRREEVAVDLGQPLPRIEPQLARLTLAVALPKGDRQKWLVEKLTELGVARLLPLVTERGVAEATESARTRMERGVIEACKQCGRNRLMEIAEPLTLEAVASGFSAAVRLIAHPGSAPATVGRIGGPDQEIVAAIGPEGGFSADEIAAAVAAGFTRVGLGPQILRVETAAIALAARLIVAPE
jgi:16S rRNA (uracil1498-N3)-methyltransferase